MKTDSIGRVLGAGEADALLRVIEQLPEPPEVRNMSNVSERQNNARRIQGKLVGTAWWMLHDSLGLER
jgi:hypothetical protein